MEKLIAGSTITVNDEGYLTDFSQWSKEIAIDIAKEEEIELTDAHWKVLEYLQESHKNQIALSIRKIGKSGVISIKELYSLFPGGPLKKSTRIAGIPKPMSCI